MPRTAVVSRVTKESEVRIALCLDRNEPLQSEAKEIEKLITARHAYQVTESQNIQIDTNVGFLDHMIHALAKHAGWSLIVYSRGDTIIDDHHTVEDTALALGQAIKEALGDAKGIKRYGYAYAPLDEALSRAVVDFSGRPYAVIELPLSRDSVGNLSTEMVPHFFQSLAQNAHLTLHIDSIRGVNDHHKMEASFKALALAFKEAFTIDSASKDVPSTKGVL